MRVLRFCVLKWSYSCRGFSCALTMLRSWRMGANILALTLVMSM